MTLDVLFVMRINGMNRTSGGVLTEAGVRRDKNQLLRNLRPQDLVEKVLMSKRGPIEDTYVLRMYNCLKTNKKKTMGQPNNITKVGSLIFPSPFY